MKSTQEMLGPAGGMDEAQWSLQAGERALYVDGDLRNSRSWFDTAYREAANLGDGTAMARAALGLGGLWVSEHRTEADSARVRTRQLDALALIDPRSSLALRLRIRLAAEEDFRLGEHATILALVAEARDAGHPEALAEALGLAHHCVLGPEHGALRLGLARELIGAAARTGRRSDLLMGLLCHGIDLFLAADPQAERLLEELRRLLDEAGNLAIEYVLSALEVMLGIRAGRFEEAEAMAAACAARGAAVGDPVATGWQVAQIGAIRWYQGRVTELL
ncbi:MAG: hypothetical protein ABIS86_03185, partial [Streptosporangiaceae bacterium]